MPPELPFAQSIFPSSGYLFFSFGGVKVSARKFKVSIKCEQEDLTACNPHNLSEMRFIDVGITPPKHAVRDRKVNHSPLRHIKYQVLRKVYKALQA